MQKLFFLSSVFKLSHALTCLIFVFANNSLRDKIQSSFVSQQPPTDLAQIPPGSSSSGLPIYPQKPYCDLVSLLSHLPYFRCKIRNLISLFRDFTEILCTKFQQRLYL